MQLHSPGRPLSIGKPNPNTNVYILDPDTSEPVPIGASGLMWAGGACVTRGYVNLPGKSMECYRPDPFIDKHRWVKSTNGNIVRLVKYDIVSCSTLVTSGTSCLFHSPVSPSLLTWFESRWNEDGTLEVLGRLDNQVKIKVCSAKMYGFYANLTVGIPCWTWRCGQCHRGTCAYVVIRPSIHWHLL